MIANVWVAKGDADLVLAGRLVVDGGDIVVVPSGIPWLEALADTPVEVWAHNQLEIVEPWSDPDRFLFALEQHYSGTAMRVEVDLDDDELNEAMLNEAYNPDQPRVPAGSPSGGQWGGEGGGDGGVAVGAGTPGPAEGLGHLDPATRAWLGDIESHPEFVKARQIIASQTPTNEMYSKNGVYTPERAALHDQIVKGFLNPNAATGPGEQPVFVMYAGAGGSGKTTALGQYLPMEQGRFTVINADDAKAKLPEYIGYNAAALHEESSHISDRLTLDAAISARHNIIFDGTGKTYAKYAEMADAAHRLGYRVELLFASVDPSISTQRAADRFLRMVASGHPAPRYVDPRYLLTNVDAKPHDTYAKLKASGSVDRAVKVDNNGNGTPRLIEDISARRQREARSDLGPRGVSRVGRHRDHAETGGGMGEGAEDEEPLEDGEFKESTPAEVEALGLTEYKDDQPRSPKGSDDGGQWTSGGGGGGGGGKGSGKRLDATDFDNSKETFEETMRRRLKGVEVQTEKIDKWNPAVPYVVLPAPMIAYHASTSNLSKSGLTPKSNDLSKKSTNLGGADNASYYTEYKLGSDEDTDPDTDEPIGQPDAVYIHAVLLPAGTKVYDPEAYDKNGSSVGEPGQLRVFHKITSKQVLGVMKVTANDKIPNFKTIRAWANKLKIK